MALRIFVAIVAVAFAADCAEAKTFREMFPGKTYQTPEDQKFVESLDYKTGAIPLNAGGVQLNVPQGSYYLTSEDARRVLIDAWGNPPSTAEGVLGMIMPAGKSPLDDSWAAIVDFEEDGYVSDEDAESIDYDDLLKQMQEATAEGSKERVKQGFPAIRLIGWASPPFYDKTTHKLHWAKELEFGDTPQHTLNYDVRALGRKGVLSMNFVAGVEQLLEIKSVIPAVMAMPEYKVGSRYEDYIPGTDKVAAYGIGALIAGKVLSKTGFLVIALAFLKKGWIVILLLLGGAWRFIQRLFGRQGPET